MEAPFPNMYLCNPEYRSPDQVFNCYFFWPSDFKNNEVVWRKKTPIVHIFFKTKSNSAYYAIQIAENKLVWMNTKGIRQDLFGKRLTYSGEKLSVKH